MKLLNGQVPESAAVRVMYSYMIIFYLCFLIAFVRLVHLFRRSKKKGWNITKAVHLMIPWGLLIRGAWFSVLMSHYYTSGTVLLIAPLSEQTPVSIVVGSLPGYWAFSNYLLVCLFWVYLCRGAYAQTTTLVKIIRNTYIFINGFVYTCWLTLMGLIIFCKCRNYAHSVEAAFISGLNFLIAVLFVIHGGRFYYLLSISPTGGGYSNPVAQKSLRMQKKVGFLTLVCVIAFFARSFIIATGYFLFDTMESTFIETCIYLPVCELVPEMLILAMFSRFRKKKGPKKKEQQFRVNATSATETDPLLNKR